jgi:hypothetical protein
MTPCGRGREGGEEGAHRGRTRAERRMLRRPAMLKPRTNSFRSPRQADWAAAPEPHERGTAHPARHVDPSEGQVPAGRPRPEPGLAVVLGPRRHTGGRGALVAVLPAQIRPRAHLPAHETDPRLDRPEGPSRGHRQPVDLAHHRRPHPAPPRPAPRRGPPPSLGATRRVSPAHSRPGAAGVSQRPRDHGEAVARLLPGESQDCFLGV